MRTDEDWTRRQLPGRLRRLYRAALNQPRSAPVRLQPTRPRRNPAQVHDQANFDGSVWNILAMIVIEVFGASAVRTLHVIHVIAVPIPAASVVARTSNCIQASSRLAAYASSTARETDDRVALRA